MFLPLGTLGAQPEVPKPRSGGEIGARFASRRAATHYEESYEGWGPSARYFRSRIFLVSQALAYADGDLLDVGCGPGMMVRELLNSRSGDFRITALDRSTAMVKACAHKITEAHNASALVGRAEAMPFSNASFDVALAMGVLEYADVTAALAEISRVTRADGLVLVTMLNPISPYRFVEWHVYKPSRRILRRIKGLLKRQPERPGSVDSGIHAYREWSLRRMMAAAGLRPISVVYYDVNFLVPPLDRYLRRWARGWRQQPDRTIGRGWRKWMGSAYMVVARNA